MAKDKKTTIEIVTDAILKALEEGTVPWNKPWISTGGKALSMSTKKPYRGFNSLALYVSSLDGGFTSPWWGTYKKINKLGGKVIQGQHPTPVSFYKFFKKVNDEGEEETRVMHRYYNVFNQQQAEGLDEVFPIAEAEEFEFTPIERAEALVEGYTNKPEVDYGGDRAFYMPTRDRIGMPEQKQFTSPEEFYSVLFHEFTHSTGHKDRLNRDLSGMQSSHKYSYEELVAEMGAAFMCYEAGIENTLDNSASYLASWSRALKDKPVWIVRAGNKAQQAFDYMLGKSYDDEEDKDAN
jgi:antirestriction protein ArdC